MFLKEQGNQDLVEQYNKHMLDEIQMISRQNALCNIYQNGIEDCRRNVLKLSKESQSSNTNTNLGFLPCKKYVDAHHACMTKDKYGFTDEVSRFAKQSSDNFFQCAFKELNPISSCTKYFDNVLRDIYRKSITHYTDDLQ